VRASAGGRYGSPMSTLLLARHAQARSYAARDHERSLTDAGVAMAERLGLAVAATQAPGVALVSSATRARQTLDVASAAGGWSCPTVALDDLYGGGPQDAVDALAGHAGRADVALVVGHEPWCSGLIEVLTGARVRMAAATLAVLRVGPAWDALDPSWCVLEWLAPPAVLTRLASA
jgi:phosphohistidine phosphatase